MHIVLLIAAILYLLVVGAFVVYAFHRGWAPWLRDRRRPVERTPADVMIKDEQREYVLALHREEVISRKIAFKCQDEKTRIYEVDEALFGRVTEGDHGILLFRGGAFVGFEPARLASDHDDIYRRLVK